MLASPNDFLFNTPLLIQPLIRIITACLKFVQTLLLSKDIYTKTHSGAKSKFHELFLKTKLLPSELGKMLQDAFDIRQDADYEFEFEISESTARQTFEDASLFLKTVKEFFKKMKYKE